MRGSECLREIHPPARPVTVVETRPGQSATGWCRYPLVYKAKEVAQRIGLLPQSSIAPDGITVADLVARGRYPYQKLIRQWTAGDEDAVAEAMSATNVTHLSGRLVDELSGGQRQRVWVAMALAQDTEHPAAR